MSPIVIMGVASGELILESEVKNFHGFYCILIHNILKSGRGGFAVKIGKSYTLANRLLDYQRMYGKKGFDILVLRRFQRKEGWGYDVRNTRGVHHRESYVDAFERHVIKELEDMKVVPMYVRRNGDKTEAASVEYYYAEDREKVLEAIMNTILKLDAVQAKPKKNRKSSRIKEKQKGERYALRSKGVAEEPPTQPPPVRTRRYQGYERGEYDKQDYEYF